VTILKYGDVHNKKERERDKQKTKGGEDEAGILKAMHRKKI